MLNWFHRGQFQAEETREYVRIPAPWPVKVEPLTPIDGRQVARTEDVSAGGICVTLPEAIPVGTALRIQIHVPPTDRTIQMEGVGVRCRPLSRGFEVGVRFTRIDPADRAHLRETIETISSSQKDPQKRAWWRSL